MAKDEGSISLTQRGKTDSEANAEQKQSEELIDINQFNDSDGDDDEQKIINN